MGHPNGYRIAPSGGFIRTASAHLFGEFFSPSGQMFTTSLEVVWESDL
jgi:hypothetical protein